MLKEFFAHPLTRRVDIDTPQCTALRRSIIQNKPFLRGVYVNWYKALKAQLPLEPGPILELGSGSGFLKDFIPGLITSDIFQVPGLDILLDARNLPFKKNTLRAIFMVNVLHHVPDVNRFFLESMECVKPGGALIMLEPWITSWSALLYKRLHHEPYHTETKKWRFEDGGPLSQGNLALPWLIFERDRRKFEELYPEWRILQITLHSPFCYLLSGGVSLRSLLPGCLFKACRQIEDMLTPWMDSLAMFATITLVRVK